MTAAGWLLPAGLPPRIGDRLRAGQGHCENESGGQNYWERERIADVPTATSTPPMRSCRPTSTKTLGPRRGLRICGDHHLHSPPLRASRQAASDRCCCPRQRWPGQSPRSGTTGTPPWPSTAVRPTERLPPSDCALTERLDHLRPTVCQRQRQAVAGTARVNRSFSLAPGRSLARARHTLAVAGRQRRLIKTGNDPGAKASDPKVRPDSGKQRQGPRTQNQTICVRDRRGHSAGMAHTYVNWNRGPVPRQESLDQTSPAAKSRARSTCLQRRLPLKCHSAEEGTRFCVRKVAIP